MAGFCREVSLWQSIITDSDFLFSIEQNSLECCRGNLMTIIYLMFWFSLRAGHLCTTKNHGNCNQYNLPSHPKWKVGQTLEVSDSKMRFLMHGQLFAHGLLVALLCYWSHCLQCILPDGNWNTINKKVHNSHAKRTKAWSFKLERVCWKYNAKVIRIFKYLFKKDFLSRLTSAELAVNQIVWCCD